jgi:hypothetical protein
VESAKECLSQYIISSSGAVSRMSCPFKDETLSSDGTCSIPEKIEANTTQDGIYPEEYPLQRIKQGNLIRFMEY